jgi:Tfp pilus assembly protein PilF
LKLRIADCGLRIGLRIGFRIGLRVGLRIGLRRGLGIGAAVLLSGSVLVVHAQTGTRRAAGDARLAEATRALSAGDTTRAMTLAKAALAQQPNDPRVHVLIARAHIRNADFDAAYLQLRRALRVAPHNADVLYYMGVVSARLAEQQLLHLAQIAPESARVHQLQAEALEAQERRSAAEEEYQAALLVKPDLLEALLGLAKLKRIRLACEEAIPLYEKAETIRPTFDGAYGLGVCYGYLQRDDEAVGKFAAATRRDPKAAVAWVGLGTSLAKTGRAAEGIPKLQQAIALEPKMGEAYYALGMAYQAARQPELAQKAFRQAEQLGGTLDSGSAPAESPRPPQ